MDLSQFNHDIIYFPSKHTKKYIAAIDKKLTSTNNLYRVQKTGLVDKVLTKHGLKTGRREEVYFIFNQRLWIIDNTDRVNFFHYPYRKALFKFFRANMQGVIKTQCSGNYNYPFPVYPFVYQPDYRLDFPKILTKITNCRQVTIHSKNYSSSVFARWDSRKDTRVVRRRVWAEACKNIPNTDIKDSKHACLDWNDYMKKISTSQFALSANGRGPLCSRDMEIASTGTPMLRQKIKVQMYVPFISGKHYIEIDANNIIETVNYYQNNYEKAIEIGKNAQKYFNTNVLEEGMQKIFYTILNSNSS